MQRPGRPCATQGPGACRRGPRLDTRRHQENMQGARAAAARGHNLTLAKPGAAKRSCRGAAERDRGGSSDPGTETSSVQCFMPVRSYQVPKTKVKMKIGDGSRRATRRASPTRVRRLVRSTLAQVPLAHGDLSQNRDMGRLGPGRMGLESRPVCQKRRVTIFLWQSWVQDLPQSGAWTPWNRRSEGRWAVPRTLHPMEMLGEPGRSRRSTARQLRGLGGQPAGAGADGPDSQARDGMVSFRAGAENRGARNGWKERRGSIPTPARPPPAWPQGWSGPNGGPCTRYTRGAVRDNPDRLVRSLVEIWSGACSWRTSKCE